MKVYRISNKMATKIKIPSMVVEVLEKPLEKTVAELIAIGLYINYGIDELEEDIAYAKSGE